MHNRSFRCRWAVLLRKNMQQTPYRRAFNKTAAQKKHYKITNAERESSESKTEQKLRSKNKKKKIHNETNEKIVHEKSGVHSRCLCMANKKRQQLTCIRFHANIASVFFLFARAASFCVLYRTFNRQHTNRHHFSFVCFFLILVVIVRCLWNAYNFFITFSVVYSIYRHTQSSISCVLANDKDTQRSRCSLCSLLDKRDSFCQNRILRIFKVENFQFVYENRIISLSRI